jgi:methyltransferase (TIGR00027 family)
MPRQTGTITEANRLTDTSWEEHYREFVHPTLLSALLREAVPVLDSVDWSVLETAPGHARTVLPLNRESTNQHGTHQAALIALAADYTGGIAIATLLNGVPVLGVHPVTDDQGAALWLVGMRITYRRPSVADLSASATIATEDAGHIQQKYTAGDPVIIPLEIRLESEGEPIGTATMSYYLRQSKELRPQASGDRLSVLYQHRVKASARLIAGLRADAAGPFDAGNQAGYDALAAGQHGKLLAQRFTALLPPLRELVVRRNHHIDHLLAAALDGGLQQLVLVGAGLDFRALRTPRGSGLRVFELDLPEMLAERARVVRHFGSIPEVSRTEVPINLEHDDVAAALRRAGFDSGASSLLIYEGMSMYFPERINQAILSSLRELLNHPSSLVWLDIVAEAVVRNSTGRVEVEQFIRGMAKLGEPFVFGLDDPAPFLERCGYAIQGDSSLASGPGGTDNPLFDLYRFYVLAPSSAGQATGGMASAA